MEEIQGFYDEIQARLKRWFETPEYQDKWVVYDGSSVSIVDSLASTRHRSICLVKELHCVVGENASLTLQEFLIQDA